jgi:energy-converting hydrogenase Eha subunit C
VLYKIGRAAVVFLSDPLEMTKKSEKIIRFNLLPNGVIIVVWIVATAILYLASVHHYLLFHILAELFTIAIAFGIFLVITNSYKLIDNNYFVFIALAYFFIGITDLAHLIVYEGMNVVASPPGSVPNLPTQLWIVARSI